MTEQPRTARTQSRASARSAAAAPVRFRAAKACRRCHEKRVKCDASERGTPCSRCTQRQEPECVLIQSRRGVYPRKPRRQPLPSTTDNRTVASPNDAPNTPGATNAHSSAAAEAAQSSSGGQEPTASFSNGPSLRRRRSSPLQHQPNVAPAHPSPHPRTQSDLPPIYDPPSGGTTGSNGSSYREVSWATTLGCVLERHHGREGLLNKYSITYVGESFPLGIVLKDLSGGSGNPPLHHPGPPCVADDNAESPGLSHPPGIRPEEIAYLEAKEAFTAPSQEVLDLFVDVFFERVFPLYPIVNPHEFLRQHKTRSIPWMLLHALCFICVTFCPAWVLRQAGYDNRTHARSLFHNKAKALFDVGYEGNKVVVLQVAILMSFWGGGPGDHWNFYTWICTGVTMAEAIGFHRSMARANIDPQDRSLIKRLWWILVIRDTTCAIVVGRPFRINLDHSDMDPLTEEDFFYDTTLSPNITNTPQAQCSGFYQIHASKLSLILRDIIAARFYPRKENALTTSYLHQMLIEWRNELPAVLKWTDNASVHCNVFIYTLCILYNHNIILTYINRPVDPLMTSPEEISAQGSLAEEMLTNAAHQIASNSCSIVTDDEGLLPPHELFHGLFIASVVFYMQTKSRDPMTARLGLSGLTNCKMALYATRETWDASPWISQLFDKVLRIPNDDSRPPAEENDNNNMGQEVPIGPLDISSFDLNGFSMPGYDGWSNHLFLGNLFDSSLNPTNSMDPGLSQ
ncbi:transcriptional regulatory protein amdr [Stemphylium lycopersici]|uniref:Transcriptional regulatory protein amdr n=1 Tax=Stemphylium lycopersici TaxID=183478 RepID=A0A364NDD9_STELY|nr:transcriptional regulatory protein amdr [Stemphylium lycopersici]RAR15324.1 transcriptional regulatory protein amdr [Stemphylium lycopersici]